jgi:hypothetical protein
MSIWQPIETATWDVLNKNDRVILANEDGITDLATVVDVAGQLGFNDQYGFPLMAKYDGFTHWIYLPKHSTK